MPTEQAEKHEERVAVEERVDLIEGILPTLSTKEDLTATEERLRAELADNGGASANALRCGGRGPAATWSASLPKGLDGPERNRRDSQE